LSALTRQAFCVSPLPELNLEHAMRTNIGERSGGEILVDQLLVHGVQHVFCVPGESYLAALDAFHDRPITLTVCRQEGGAAIMAEAIGKATGRPSPSSRAAPAPAMPRTASISRVKTPRR